MFPTLLLLLLTLLFIYRSKEERQLSDLKIILVNAILVFNWMLMFLAQKLQLNEDFSLGLIFSFFNGSLLIFLLGFKNKYLFVHFYIALMLLIVYVIVYSTSLANNVDFMLKANCVALITTGILNIGYACLGFVTLSKSSLKSYYRCIPTFYIISLFIGSFLGISFLFTETLLLSNIAIYTLHVALVLVVSVVFLAVHTWKGKRSEKEGKNVENTVIAQPKVAEVVVEVREKSLAIVDIEAMTPITDKIEGDQAANDLEIKQLIWREVIEPQLYLKHDLTLSKLSKILKRDKAELKDFFARTEANTFTHYINRFRIEYAVTLLRTNADGDLNVEKAAELCGFNSRVSFYRAFVNVMGFPPSELLES
ncbi:helix-turn-helix domain-containing protein [Myroides sp. BIT-d1]|uniref:Helix-turn-helix domain-containing protein n=1 Tax=Myroides albus TaxID=2562892 RepID=A0A6I3LNB1_9FLAO|nr:AraC family transcriptional regulator [Myroides albus]MTG99364.1 helix-turn-helix domain-containing protein [Myroides albus]